MLLIRGQVIHTRTSTESTCRSASISIASFFFVWRAADAERSILADAFDSLPFLLSMTTLPKEKAPNQLDSFFLCCVERDGRRRYIVISLVLLFLLCVSLYILYRVVVVEDWARLKEILRRRAACRERERRL